jgi:hypothetical protein
MNHPITAADETTLVTELWTMKSTATIAIRDTSGSTWHLTETGLLEHPVTGGIVDIATLDAEAGPLTRMA